MCLTTSAAMLSTHFNHKGKIRHGQILSAWNVARKVFGLVYPGAMDLGTEKANTLAADDKAQTTKTTNNDITPKTPNQAMTMDIRTQDTEHDSIAQGGPSIPLVWMIVLTEKKSTLKQKIGL
jgi:hypothetical protein